MAKSLGTKLYYSIGEVAELTELAPYTLRAWENEFACLRPKRVRGKNRAYRRRDIAIILLIRRLLHEERYSTRGAQQKLRNEPDLIRGAVDHLEALHAGTAPPLEALAGGPSAASEDSETAAAAAPAAAAPVQVPPSAPAPADDEAADGAAAGAAGTAGAPTGAPRDLLRQVRDELRQILDLLPPRA